MSGQFDSLFRYPVREKIEGTQRNLLVEMIRTQLASLLNLLSIYQNGVELKPDGFRLLMEREGIHPIFSQEKNLNGSYLAHPSSIEKLDKDESSHHLGNAELYEPRIPHIQRVLESILSVVELEENGRTINVDAFRLKSLDHWLVPSAGDPAEVFDHLATRCDCHCSFCYLRGNPPSLALEQPTRKAEEEYSEVQTRLKYFSPGAKRALFPSLGSPYEVLTHPYALDLLSDLRKKTERPFRLSTNGNSLTEAFIQKLSLLKPIYLYLSLNSASIDRRSRIMGGKNSEVAIRSLPLLQKSGIPYAVVIVPWPFPTIEEMLLDLQKTVAYADAQDAHLVEVSLPGTSKYFSEVPPFDLEEVWASLVSQVRSLRLETQCPLLVKPSLYEETRHEKVFNQPGILGIVKNSPAAGCGLQPGDLILSIGGLKTSSRPQARDLLRLHHQSGTRSISIGVQRGPETKEILLSPTRFDYPYTPEMDHHFGIVFGGEGFRPSIVEELKTLILTHGAKRVLLFSSRLVKPVLDQLLSRSPLPGDIQMTIEIPANNFFGGNIFMGDLLVVQDFIDAIQAHLKTHPPPDLIIIPSTPFSLGSWKRDLEGRVYSEIERAVDLPVVLLDCEPIYD